MANPCRYNCGTLLIASLDRGESRSAFVRPFGKRLAALSLSLCAPLLPDTALVGDHLSRPYEARALIARRECA